VSLTRLQQIGLSVAILCILGALAVGIYARNRPTPRPPSSPTYTPPPSPAAPAAVVVQVAGAVVRPGVYTLPRNVRVQQAVEAAGGMLPEADTRQVNLAALVEDGQKVDIPFAAATPPPPVTAPSAGQAPSTVVDLNTATAEQLDQLPNIGPTLAERIIEYRQRSGPFRSVDDLNAVPGLGPKRLEQIRPYVTVQ